MGHLLVLTYCKAECKVFLRQIFYFFSFSNVIAWRLSKIRAKYFHLRINFPWRPILTNDISANFPTGRTAQIMWDQWHGRFYVGTNNCFTMSIQTKMKQDHLMMNVAPDQTIILSLQIFLDQRSLSSIDQKMLMTQIFVVSVSVKLYKCICFFYLSWWI